MMALQGAGRPVEIGTVVKTGKGVDRIKGQKPDREIPCRGMGMPSEPSLRMDRDLEKAYVRFPVGFDWPGPGSGPAIRSKEEQGQDHREKSQKEPKFYGSL
jgi:hypothetical protein